MFGILEQIRDIRALSERLERLEETYRALLKEQRDLRDDYEYSQVAIARLRGTITGGRRGKVPPDEENGQKSDTVEQINQAIKEGRLL